ncbi:unnamed protein product [Dovyalis caffra]|uniref:Nicotianamine synthase n=1 Tax=Dovyalis caffra TaxID=77055 RepID=A0AAV1QXA3_9ROSI|nr:unnamed protein product [Dovyalis caffra]
MEIHTLSQSCLFKAPFEGLETTGFTRVAANCCSKTFSSGLMGYQEELLIEKVCEIYDKLSRLENLNPSKQVNSLLTQLVRTCMSQCHIDITKLSERVQLMRCKLIKLCGKGEGLLESYFATYSHGQATRALDKKKVCEIHGKISRLENLNPSKQVDSLFSQLVTTCKNQRHIDATKLSEGVQEISSLINLCGKAEGLLESHFSNLIGSHENPLDNIRLLPYHSNYLKLSQLQFSMLRQNCPQVPKRMSYDKDPSANSKALNLVSSNLELFKRMAFHTADIMNVSSSLKQYEVILAPLVGVNKEEKVKVINHLAKHMSPGALLLLRSAHGSLGIPRPCSRS